MIIVPYEPIAQIRPRICRNRMYDPLSGEKKKWKWEIARQMRTKELEAIQEGPIGIEVTFYTKKPKSLSKRKQMALTWNHKRADLDNYLKFILDVLNGIGFKDDGQVAKIEAIKIYDDNPRVEFSLILLH